MRRSDPYWRKSDADTLEPSGVTGSGMSRSLGEISLTRRWAASLRCKATLVADLQVQGMARFQRPRWKREQIAEHKRFRALAAELVDLSEHSARRDLRGGRRVR